jgi:23S rRNA pseudouridine2605 synthase|tara:strand:- start:9929 stop:10795 length:867 start_codon:yes stop_codon:yes gene_type:complete
MRYICKKLIMAKANYHSDKRVGKSKPSKLKSPETSYSKKKLKPSQSKSKASSNPDEIRLNKYIANSGMCSRREADMHISIGSVIVNGKVVTEMGYKVLLDDDVRFDGARINPEKKAYVLLNKPKGFATTTSEGKGRTVMDLVANSTAAKIRPIGRLGRNSLGLILFTNDEQMHSKFTNSKHGVVRLFHMELDRSLKFEHLKSIQEGFKYEGKLVSVEAISFIDGAPKNEIGLQIKNTGNTILRKIFDHFNYDIIKMDCVTIGPLSKKDLPRGHWKHLSDQEVSNLMML